MEFICYYSFHELPLNNGDYDYFRDRTVYGYRYNLGGDSYLAILVEDNCYAVFRVNGEEIDNPTILAKAHEITRFYRETKGVQTRHLSADTIRQIETLCNVHRVNDQAENAEFLSVADLRLEKKHTINGNDEYWHITFNDRTLLSLNHRNTINRIFDIICSDITAYVLQRWRRILQ